MREQEILFEVIDILESNFPDFNIQTVGGEGTANLPAIVVNWSANRRSDYQGNTPIGGYEYDDQGNKIGIILHRYYQMDLDIEVKSHSESERDTTLAKIQDLFLPFERNADLFHEDTTEWQVGSIKPRNNPVIEPDWYESGILVQFRFVSEVVDDNVDTITGIQKNIDEEL